MLKDLITETRANHFLGADARHELAQFEANWRKMGGHEKTDHQCDMRKTGLALAQPHAFILQQVAPGAGRIRIVGHHLSTRLKLAANGISFGALFTDAARETALELMDAAFTLPSIVSIPLVAKRGSLRRPVKAQILLLPLWDPSGQTTHILGALVADRDQKLDGLAFDIPSFAPFRCEPLVEKQPDRRNAFAPPRLIIDNAAAQTK